MIRRVSCTLVALRTANSGAAMVEFAICLPLLLLVMAIIVEGTRITWTYQAAASGVRDATRMIARLAPDDICTGTANIGDFKTEATDIVQLRAGTAGEQILPTGVLVLDVTPSLNCVDVDYSTVDVAVVEIRATIQIAFPFGGVFALVGGELLDPITTQIADQTRVYGI